MRYRLLGQHTGLRVSELVLGTGAFGTGWGHGAEIAESRRILDAYAQAGGNFIDTANGYQFGQSETQLGELLQGRRDEFVIASKYTQGALPSDGLLKTGNSRRAMVTAVEESLKRLRTDRIDLYWAHFADGLTPIDEILRGFDDLSRAGKILYAGLSDFPAWRVARASAIAELRGLLPVAALQIEHSLVQRSSEHELLPMGQALGLGMVAWSPLGGGVLTGKYRRGEVGRAQGFGGRVFQAESTEQRSRIIDCLLSMAEELGVTSSQIAISWVTAHGALPIIGPRTYEQLIDNLGAARLSLSSAQIAALDSISAIEPIFPRSMIDSDEMRQSIAAGVLDRIEVPHLPVR